MQQGFGKIILIGEHAVVHGFGAIVAALHQGARAYCEVSEENSLILESAQHAEQQQHSEKLERAFQALLAQFPNGKTCTVRAVLNIPGGAGLGASAALGVAIARALGEFHQLDLSPTRIVDIAYDWERVFHGNPSGIDLAAASYGGLGFFARETGFRRIDCAQSLICVVGNSGQTSSTQLMVDSVQRQKQKDPKKVEKVFHGIGAIAHNAKTAIETGNLSHLGQLMTLNQTLLNSLMLSTNKIEEMCEVAKRTGALGAKLTGAGGGGCMIALAAGAQNAIEVQQALKAFDPNTFVAQVQSTNSHTA